MVSKNKMVKIRVGFSDDNFDGVTAFVEKNIGHVGWRRTSEIAGEREEMTESLRERLLEMGKKSLCEMKCWMRESIEENSLHGAINKPYNV